MKLALYDKYEALRRHPEYEKDWLKLQEPLDDNEYETLLEELKEKYQIPKIPTPWSHSYRKKPFRYEEYNPIEIIPQISNNHPRKTLEVSDFVEAGRFLQLKVDLTIPLTYLTKYFEDKVKEWRALTGNVPESSRRGQTSVDPWEVYDMRIYQDKSLLQITRDLFGVQDHPSYDSTADSRYKQVKRAYRKAQEMLRAVNP